MYSYINLSIIKQAYNYVVSNKVINDTTNNQILEPFSTLLKLAIISFKNTGVKIAIHSNKLYLQKRKE